MYEWLVTPIDPDRVHQVGFFISWHGRFMTVAWAGMIPLGIIIARFFKITPTQNWPQQLDNKQWWHGHRFLQYGGVAITAIGTILILFRMTEVMGTAFHTRVGWFVVILAAMQIASGIYRGTKGGPTAPAPDGSLAGDHFDMTPYRCFFEYYHKAMGYVLFIAATYSIVTGMWIANAYNWMWLVLGLWWLILVIFVVYLQRTGACFDTYLAIWGPDKDLPGNKLKPIGWGVNTDTPWKRP